jgi:plasmid stabilization system protein ParE
MNIIVSKKAQNDLNSILVYIAEAGYPETAHRYLDRLMEFINSLVL